MLTYRYVDDGWYCQDFWIEDENGKRFAMTQNESAAKEICEAVNKARAVETFDAEIPGTIAD